MIKNSRSEPVGDVSVTEKDARTCWGARTRIPGVRFEDLESTSAVVFSYAHLERAEWMRAPEGESLHVHFSSYSVRIEGRNLRELLAGFQEMEVEWVRPVPARFVSILPQGAAVVVALEVREREDHRPAEAVSG